MTKKRVAETISIAQLLRRFHSQAECLRWLEQVLWGSVPTCPHCGGRDMVSTPKSKPSTYWCGACRKHFTVTTGTVMHATKTPLQNWVAALYLVMTARKGVSAMQLSKELGVQYRTAWYMLHRIREAHSTSDLKLNGTVEADETFIGGKRKNMPKAKRKATREAGMGRGATSKVPVMGAKERGGPVVAKPVEDADMETATKFVMSSTDESATVYTDESRIYGQIPHNHDSVCHSAEEYVRGDVHTNSIESVWALLKRSIHGTWHHVSPKHLHRYVNEAAMRLNIGDCQIDTMDRMEACVRRIRGKRMAYRDLIS